ncbi:MAG: hypothetical protein M1830_009166 [Pleopsidium flavum]|nr:MAG: hypothetical protein M1830_009166 [Pleopsidium flavum]
MELEHLLSPSKARIHQARAKDWTYISTWLATKYFPSTPPPFERNEETLKVLLALASLNESADEEKELLANVERDALMELNARRGGDPDVQVLSSVEHNLTREGRTSLDVLASISVAVGGVPAEHEMAGKIIELTAAEFEMQQQVQRVETMQSHLARELSAFREQLAEVRGEVFQAPANLPQKTSEWRRSSKLLNIKLAEYKDRLTVLERGKAPALSIAQIIGEEKDVFQLQGVIEALEGKESGFKGLPRDTGLAKVEVERVRRELVTLDRKRDGLFEGLVENSG